MHPTIAQYAQTLNEMTDSVPSEKIATIVTNFMHFLKRRGESAYITAILASVEKMEAEKRGVVKVTVVTAREVSPDVRNILETQAQTLFVNKRVELCYEIDAHVIGGVRFQTDEIQYDATVLATLNNFKKILL